MLIALQREDVVLPGDLALRKAVRAAYQLDHLPAQEEVLAIAEKWRPYRSLATSYLFSSAFEPAEAPPAAQPGTLDHERRRFASPVLTPGQRRRLHELRRIRQQRRAALLSRILLAQTQNGRESFVDTPLLVWGDPAH